MKEIFITSSVLIVALLLLRLAFRRTISRRAQYALWALVLARLLIPISLPASPASVMNFTPTVMTFVSPPVGGGLPDAPPLVSAPLADAAKAEGGLPDAPAPLSTPAVSPPTNRAAPLTLNTILTRVWLAGIAAMTCFFLVTNLLFWRRLRNGRTPYPVERCKRPVYLCEGLPSPCLFGLFRPAIYLTPAAVRAPDTLRHVLAHEETHARHLDPLWSLLRCLCLTLYWFHPLVWAAAWASKADCELSCDEGTLRRLGEAERLSYGQTLLALIPVRKGPGNPLLSATTMTSGKRQLKNRVICIAEHRKTLTVALVSVAVLSLAVAACTFTGAKKEEGRRPLTGEELRYFNEEYFNNVTRMGDANPHNYFISSLYEKPEDIDLYELFYLGIFDESGQFPGPSDEESQLLYGDSPPDRASYKQTTAEMDAFLKQYTGLPLEETNKVGLDNFTYLPQYDAYYWAHGDTNYQRVRTLTGEREGDLITLYYDASYTSFASTGYACLTMKEVDGGYHFLSNQICEKPAIATPLPDREPVLTIPLAALTPYEAPALTVTRRTGDFAEQLGGYSVGKDGAYTVRLYRSTDGNTYAAVVLNDAWGAPEWEVDAFLTLPDSENCEVTFFSNLFGRDGLVVSYYGTRSEGQGTAFCDYITFTAGTPTLLARAYGEAKILDLDGDGTDELVSDDQIFFQRDGQVFEADLRALLQAAWPEMTYWDYARWNIYGKYLIVSGLCAPADWDGEVDASFTRYLYFDGKDIPVYQNAVTKDHVLEGVAAPDEVLAAAKEKAYADYLGVRNEDGQRPAPRDFDNWRVVSLNRMDTADLPAPRPGVTLELYSVKSEFHSAAPENFYYVGGNYIDEDGWCGGFYTEKNPYLVFQVVDGQRVLLKNSLSTEAEPGSPVFQHSFLQTLIQNGLVSGNDTTLLPEGAAQFEARLRDWIIPQYGGLAEGETFTLDYQSNPPQIDDLDCWAFDAYRGSTVTSFGSEECLGRYYADKTTGQVYHHKTPDWFLAQIPNSFLFPETIPSETVQNDILHHVWRQIPETGYEYGRVTVFPPNNLTLMATYPDWHFPDEPGDGDSVGVYYCPVSLPERPSWTDPTPYLVLSPASGGGYYYLGALDEAGATSEATVQALANAYAAVDVQYVNFHVGNDAYDATTGYYSNDDYHFTWQLPDGVRNDILFRDTGRGVGVYFRPTYERYVAEHGGVDDGAVSDPVGCGRLLEIIAGPEKTRLYDGTNWDALNILPMCQNDGDLLNALPAPNGWYYAAYTDVAWLPGSAWAWYYPQQAQALLQAFSGLNPV